MRPASLVALLVLVLGLAGCHPDVGCEARSLERTISFSLPGRASALYLFREDYYSVQRETLPAFGDLPEETGGGLRRLKLTLEAPERLAVVLEPFETCVPTWSYDLDCRGFTRSELEGALPGSTLPSGGIFVGAVRGKGSLTLEPPLPTGRLTVVRLDPAPADGYVMVAATARFEFNAPLGECHYLAYGPVAARCGDGLRDAGEQCDDENVADGDGCSAHCWRESSYCTSDGQLWLKGCDDGEPSRCESRACEPDDPDPRCHVARGLRAATFVTGRFAPGQDVAGRLSSTPAGLDCACGHEVVGAAAGRDCAAACTAEVPACTTEVAATAGADAPLASWGGWCWGTGTCHAPGLADYPAIKLDATFATADEGLDLARPLVSYWPGASPAPAALAATADGGVLVALAYGQPFAFAGQQLTADGPSAMIARLAADGSLAWLHRLSVRPGEELAVHAVAAAAGGAVLVGAFRGRLDASGFDLQSAVMGTRELFVAAYAADGTPRFATHVELGTAYTTSQAAVAAGDAGSAVALAATVRPLGAADDDLALVALEDGAGARGTRGLGAAPAGSVLGRGIGVLPGGDWLVAGLHAASTDAGGLLPARSGPGWVHFVTRLAPDGEPRWTTALGESTEPWRASAFAVDRASPGAWATLPLAPAGTRLVRLDVGGAVTAALSLTAEEAAPRLGVDPLAGDALLAGNGAPWTAELDAWEVWLARVSAAGEVVWSQRHSGRPARGLTLDALAVAPGGRALLLADYRSSPTLAGATLQGCGSYANPCTALALLGAQP